MAKFFNTNLKFLRTQRGISQQEIADTIGTDRSTISRWENGEIDTPLEMAIKISDFFNIPYYDFFGKDLRFPSSAPPPNDNLIKQYETNGAKVTLSLNDELTPEEQLNIQKFVMTELTNLDNEFKRTKKSLDENNHSSDKKENS